MPDVLIATDAASVFEDIRAVVDEPGTTLRWIRSGQEVRDSLRNQSASLAIVDMQIGTMGGIAIAMDIQLEQDAGRLDPCPVLLLADRRADTFMARRSGVAGWLVKPLDPIRIRRAVSSILAGGTWYDETYQPQPVAAPFVSASVERTGK